MFTIRGFLVVSVLLGAGHSLLAADSPGDLAIRARAILKKHCAECHDGQPGRTSLSILDYQQLVPKERTLPPFVKPKSPQESQIVDFIEEGSMPQGNRTKLSAEEIGIVKSWIESGAGGYPQQFDNTFAHARIRDDLESAQASDRKFYRYFSLHHLLSDDRAGVGLSTQRESFRKALSAVSTRQVNELKAIDPTETIFRVDLRELGWNGTPFQLFAHDGKKSTSPLNLFDLLLLEYPFGEMPAPGEYATRIADLWLRSIDQVRPIIFLKADWFAKAVETSPLKTDFKKLLGLGVKARSASPEKMHPEFRPEDLPNIPIRPLAKAYPILPIDAWYANDVEVTNGPKVTLRITDANGKPASKFKSGDRMRLSVESSEPVCIQLIRVDPDGAVIAHDLDLKVALASWLSFVFQVPIPPNSSTEVQFEGKKNGLVLGDAGKQRFIIFAAKDAIPPGELLVCDGVEPEIDRFVHRIYELPTRLGDPLRFDATRMVRKTAIIEVGK